MFKKKENKPKIHYLATFKCSNCGATLTQHFEVCDNYELPYYIQQHKCNDHTIGVYQIYKYEQK